LTLSLVTDLADPELKSSARGGDDAMRRVRIDKQGRHEYSRERNDYL
jgi:hypothetical protein